MGWFTRKVSGATEKAADMSSFPSLMSGIPTAAGVKVTDDTALKVSAVFACVRVISEDIAKLPVAVTRKLKNGKRVPAADLPLCDILRKPNKYMSRVSFMKAMAASYAFRGNAVAVILRGPDDRPVGLWPVPPGDVQIIDGADGNIYYSVARSSTVAISVLRDYPPFISPRDIVHIKGTTFNGLVGLSPMSQMREAIGIAVAGEMLSGSQMANGAEVGGILKYPKKLTDDLLNRLRGSWTRRYTGPGKAGATVILEDGMSFEKLGMTSVDAQFLDQRKLTIEEIARGFRVPLHMIGYLDKAAGNNSQEEASQRYYNQTLSPALKDFEEEFERAFEIPSDCDVTFDVRALLRADFKTRQEGNRLAYQSGAMSPNEWREDIGMDPVEGGDVYARPLNTAFVDASGKVVSVTPAGGNDTGASANG